MSDPLHVLLVEDSEDDALLVLRELRRGGFTIIWERVETAPALRIALTNRCWDVLISDYRLPKFDAPAALKIVKQAWPDLPFIVVSGTIGEASAVELMKAGAHDYLMKDSLTRLPEAVRREVREAQIRQERQQAAIDLDEAKERLQLAIEGSGIGLWDWVIPSGSVTLNDRWAEMIGYTLAELEPIGIATWHNHTHPEDLQKAMVALEQHFQKVTQVYECEVRMRHKSGLWVWILARGKVVEWDEAGHPLRMTGTHLDISDRKLAETTLQAMNQELEERVALRTAALQQSEARLREAQQIAHLGSWELDVETRETSWSDEIFSIFGLDPNQPAPSYEQLLHYFPAEEQIRFKQLVDRAIQFGEPYQTDFQIIRADGSSGYIFIKAELICNTVGQTTRLFGIAMDISDRKAMQEALQRSEERARATLLALPDLVFRVNRAGEYVDFLASPEGRNLIDPHLVIGKSIYEVLPADILATHAETKYAAIQQALNTQTVQIYEQELWVGNQLRYEEVRVAPCGNEEVVFFVRDISDRKQSETQLQRTNEELARATRLKDEFLANMSHELRTPLNAILGMTESLQEQIFGAMNDRQLKALQTIESSGTHLLELINDILDVAKIESGQIELACNPISIRHLCQSSLAFIKQQALQKHIQLQVKLPSQLPELVVDERRIRQVLINLLNNAVKFTPDGGEVTLEITLEKLLPDLATTDSQPQDFLRIAVIDTGIGISPENIKRLFQPFIQVDSALNRQYTGTGLGLALVKRLVEMHGGRVGLTSELGVGSCFTIDLPCDRSRQSYLESVPCTNLSWESSAEPQATAPLILLVEDNEANINTLSSYLTAKGYQIIGAKNAQEALKLIQTMNPDLVLMDIQMPGMDGLQAIQTIRLDLNRPDIPIIALTALAMPDDQDRCLSAGANCYLPKPVRLKQLAITIQQCLGLQNPLPRSDHSS